MSQIKDIFIKVLEDIVPTSQELQFISKTKSLLTKLLNDKAEMLNIDFTTMEAQGSTGIKQTQLRNDFDIDFFIGLNYNDYKERYDKLSKNKQKKEIKQEFRRLCKQWIIAALNPEHFKNPGLLYAEHPYVTVDYYSEGIKVVIDIVLYFDLSLEYIQQNGPITAVDRSPWHGRFIQENLTPQQKNDVRLLKQFFKACHCYGDKSPVGKIGFIGYSAELLIYFYGTLSNLFENFEYLKIFPLDYYKRKKEELLEISHFQNDYLIIIDPIDKNRNVASAISEKAYKYCNHMVKKFLLNPDKNYFKINDLEEIDLVKEQESLSSLFILECKSALETTHYTILRDKLYSLGDNIRVHGEMEYSHDKKFGKIVFEVVFNELLNEYSLALYCESPKISKTYLRKGPPLQNTKNVNQFKKKNPNFLIKDGFLWVETERAHSQFIDFLRDHVKKNLSDYLLMINLSEARKVETKTGKQSLYVLKHMILPFST